MIRFLLMMALFSALACSKPPAEYSFSEEQFLTLLADAHLLEARLQKVYAPDRDSIAGILYQQFFEIHNISEQDWKSNLASLSKDPVYMEKLYEKVLEELRIREAQEAKKK